MINGMRGTKPNRVNEKKVIKEFAKGLPPSTLIPCFSTIIMSTKPSVFFDNISVIYVDAVSSNPIPLYISTI